MASGQAKKIDERWVNSASADGKAVGCVLSAPVEEWTLPDTQILEKYQW